MLSKILVLCFLGAVLAKNVQLQDAAADLKLFFADIDKEVKSLKDETEVQIRANAGPLSLYIQNAQQGLANNLTLAADPYWAKIRALTEKAQEKGQDISACLNTGNEQLFALNNTVTAPVLQKYDSYNQAGNSILSSSSAEANTVLEELNALEQLVQLCSNDVCAADLTIKVQHYYSRAKDTLNDAETRVRNYVLIYLPELLSYVTFDANSYVTQYSGILNQISICTDKLYL